MATADAVTTLERPADAKAATGVAYQIPRNSLAGGNGSG